MAETKKSFLLYFDMYRQMMALSAAQRGELIAALFEYARSEAEKLGSGGTVLNRHPDMTPEARMAFLGMTETIRRDTEKWHQKHLRYQQAAQKRCAEQQGGKDEIDQYVQALKKQRENA